MKNLYIILRKDSNPTSLALFRESAKKRGINIKEIFTDGFDFSAKTVFTRQDGLVRLSTDPESRLVEKFLVNTAVNTFYADVLSCMSSFDNVIESPLLHQKNNLPIIPTIFSITGNKELLKKYVDALDGFPIIIKSINGSHGAGVMKIDSFPSLSSVVDYLVATNGSFTLRKFIPHKRQGRLIVLGDKVIASHENYTSVDFRTNVGNSTLRKRGIAHYEESICQIAVSAVKSLHYEFGGVDILFDEKTEEPFISEVNCRCFFPATQTVTGVDIAGAMIDYLVEKSRRSDV